MPEPTESFDVLAETRFTLTVRVRDVAASVQWYRTVFGLDPLYEGIDRSLDGASTAVAAFQLAGGRIWLSPLHSGDARTPVANDAAPSIAFMTTTRDLVALRAELVARGARVDDGESIHGFPADADGIRRGADADFFYIYDLDDNRIEFCRTF